ncbi:MAG TPA: PAS domain S-box protein [Hydrogenophaga sp.]|uniref:PAS domain S-box protein n=1 Tax=Hydrogenophaga sp. TaxID=1904254 RepID=UPI002CEAD971|nr:PAS domain S-box protein [Hydrogenophaga sp.]HMN93421.1 PAS domain S-box protein [Hydrogenophaga sp.]HMP10315.1 PAS domain S-box protein [Hydrogenophaga sp.]
MHPHHPQGGVWLVLLSGMAIVLLIALSFGLLLTQRDATLERALAQTKREVQRLAGELDQTLRMAQASIEIAAETSTEAEAGSPGAQKRRRLVASLTLPFELHRLPAEDAAPPSTPTDQWLPGLPRQIETQWFVPLAWRSTERRLGDWEVRLSRDALLSRFASEDMPEGSSMSLFRIEDDGATTLLARYPLVESEQGRTIRGHLAQAVTRSNAGVFEAQAQIDGIRRIVGYRQLEHPGQRLLVVYALGSEGVLAAWNALVPWTVLLTLLLAGSMAWGSHRLLRSVQALRQSEQHFQNLSRHLPDVIARHDRQGRILYINPAVAKANGLSPEAMIGRHLTELGAPPAVTAAWMACLERVFTSGIGETLYFDYPGPLGNRHWESQVTPEPTEPGHPPTVLVVSRDITERREAEVRRDSAQRLFEAVFMTAPDAMSLSDWTDGRLLLVNDAFCELFGQSRDALIGRTSTELGLWSAAQRRQDLLEALSRGESVRNQEGSSTRHDGQEIHVRFSAERVQVDGHERLLVMFRDVTQLEREQRALARSELRFRLAAAQGQVWEWDFERDDFSPSSGFFVQLGHAVSPDTPLAQVFGEIVPPEDLMRLRWQLRRYLKGEADFQVEFRARDAAGAWHWFEAQGSGLRDELGRVTYMAGTAFEVSDRKVLEEAQRQTLNRLETITNASKALLWTSGTDGSCDWVNQRWLDFTGQQMGEVMGEGWTTHVHPEDLPHVVQAYEEALNEREPYSGEFRLRNSAGEYRWLLEQSHPRYDADNRFIGYICSCLDITELKQAEASARHRGAMLEQVFDVLQDMLFVVDGQERFVFHQSGRRDQLYRTPEEFLGKTLGEVMPADLVVRFREAMDAAWTGGPQEIDYTLALPDGEHHFNARLAWLDGGEQCLFLVRDNSEQQNARLERERLNRFVLLLFRLASRFINLPVQGTDAAIHDALGDMGRFVDADRAYIFAYDFATDTASNTHEWCADGVSPEIDKLQNLPFELIPEWIDKHRQGQVMHVPETQDLPPGGLRDILEPQGIRSLMALPLMYEGRCLGFVGLDSVRNAHRYGAEETTLLELFAQMLVNIRLRVDAEEQIRELTEQLEHKVAERTAQLEESVQQLRATNRELESFTYSASHDLRTPLRGIEGFSSLLLQEHAEQLDDQGLDYLRRIQKATLHMSRLVSDLLAYSRLQHTAQHIEAVRLLPCIEAVVQPFQDELAARQGRLELDLPADLSARADAQGLGIVLRNLIDNALKFTPPDRMPLIRISGAMAQGLVQLRVSDNGMGFDMKHHERIFGMFQRLHRQDQIPGTGIGLAMVHKAIERMGGRIRAESQPGQGSTFIIDLPATAAPT